MLFSDDENRALCTRGLAGDALVGLSEIYSRWRCSIRSINGGAALVVCVTHFIDTLIMPEIFQSNIVKSCLFLSLPNKQQSTLVIKVTIDTHDYF